MFFAESKFQQNVIRYLTLRNIFFFSVPNGVMLKPSQARVAKAQGLKAGVSDIVILLPKRCVFVEFKNPNGKGRQSDSQKEFQKAVEGLGFEYVIWDSWDKVEEFVKGVK